MSITPISFTAKIPVSRCNIYDKSKDSYVGATLYEYDCFDLSDRDEIRDLEGTWTYKEVIAEGILSKIARNIRGEESIARFFSLKDDDGHTLGICYVNEVAREMQINYISKRMDDTDHKMIGQAMLASLADVSLNENKFKLVIKTAVSSAYDFYEKVCGFRPVDDEKLSDLVMNRSEMARFIRRTEEKTQGEIKLFA